MNVLFPNAKQAIVQDNAIHILIDDGTGTNTVSWKCYSVSRFTHRLERLPCPFNHWELSKEEEAKK